MFGADFNQDLNCGSTRACEINSILSNIGCNYCRPTSEAMFNFDSMDFLNAAKSSGT